MLKFIYDRILDRANICNLKEETLRIKNHISNNQNVVLFAPRNYGKTSLVKSIIMPDFEKKHKKSFVLFVDLMGVKDIQSLTTRLKNGLELSMKKSMPIKNIIKSSKSYLKSLRPTINFSIEGNIPRLNINTVIKDEEISIEDIFTIIKNISKDYHSLIILDEFQDIVKVEESEARLRNIFQNINIPVIVLGSKKHILADIFVKPHAPLANFGNDVVIKPIKYQEYHIYMNKRFIQNGNKINLKNSKLIQDLMQRVPEAINMLCYEINLKSKNQQISEQIIYDSLIRLLEMRQSRFESLLNNFSKAEETVITAIAKNNGFIESPNSKDFVNKVNLTPRSISLNIAKLLEAGHLEKDRDQYQITDPLLLEYLKRFRS
ncbi:MAG: hypothetical protein ISQ32_03620 [Rickettsiales bacterium]|nr:hypothetical protein [Rickettsiales bacterium]